MFPYAVIQKFRDRFHYYAKPKASTRGSGLAGDVATVRHTLGALKAWALEEVGVASMPAKGIHLRVGSTFKVRHPFGARLIAFFESSQRVVSPAALVPARAQALAGDDATSANTMASVGCSFRRWCPPRPGAH